MQLGLCPLGNVISTQLFTKAKFAFRNMHILKYRPDMHQSNSCVTNSHKVPAKAFVCWPWWSAGRIGMPTSITWHGFVRDGLPSGLLLCSTFSCVQTQLSYKVRVLSFGQISYGHAQWLLGVHLVHP